jgi:GT2 family glycosyltransferase
MTMPRPDITVIIPTHNRRASVCRTLTALAAQTMAPARFEAIVVVDGCTDDTGTFLRTLALPFQLRVIEQRGQGQGRARNLGVEHATAPLLVFLDDDIEPDQGMLTAYLRKHADRPGALLIGHTPPVLPDKVSLFQIGLRNWWHDHIHSLKQEAHRFTYRDMHSGNFAIAAGLFARSGGFDGDFSGRSGEDYELGVRLLNLSVPFVFVADALGQHHDASDLSRSLSRVQLEGRADVLIGWKHPELRSGLPLARPASRRRVMRALRALAFTRPAWGDRIASLLRAALGPLEQLKFRGSWHRVHGAVRSYWYYRGVAEELAARSLAELHQFIKAGRVPRKPLPDLHLDDGLAEARRSFEALRPTGARLCLAGIPIRVIPTVPGAEPLRADHLPFLLAEKPAERFLIALAMSRVQGNPSWGQFPDAGTDPP